MPVTVTWDSHYCTYLGHLVGFNTNRNCPNAKASKQRAISLTFSPTNFVNVHEPLSSTTKCDQNHKFMAFIHLVTPKAGAKHELLFNKQALRS